MSSDINTSKSSTGANGDTGTVEIDAENKDTS